MTDRAAVVAAGLLVLIITGIPTALVSYAIRTGAVGSAPNFGLTIVAYLIIIVLFFVIINLVVDIIYSILDPRVRIGGQGQ